jgi:hypothetical protein
MQSCKAVAIEHILVTFWGNKLRRMQRRELVAHIGRYVRNACKTLVRKPNGRTQIGKSECQWRIILKYSTNN